MKCDSGSSDGSIGRRRAGSGQAGSRAGRQQSIAEVQRSADIPRGRWWYDARMATGAVCPPIAATLSSVHGPVTSRSSRAQQPAVGGQSHQSQAATWPCNLRSQLVIHM